VTIAPAAKNVDSTLAGQDSHLLDDERNFKETSHFLLSQSTSSAWSHLKFLSAKGGASCSNCASRAGGAAPSPRVLERAFIFGGLRLLRRQRQQPSKSPGIAGRPFHPLAHCSPARTSGFAPRRPSRPPQEDRGHLPLRTRARAAITAKDKPCSSTPEGSGAGMSPKSTTGTSSPKVQSTSRFWPST